MNHQIKIMLLLAPIIFIGCVNPFAPSLNESGTSSSTLISDQKDVEGLFKNFNYAYTFKDTLIYGQLLNSDFSFIYRDYDLGLDISWGRDDEMRVTHGLFGNSQKLDLIWNNIVSISDDSTNIIRSFNLTITFNPTDIIFVDGRVNLNLQKNSLDQWQIVSWIDESNF